MVIIHVIHFCNGKIKRREYNKDVNVSSYKSVDLNTFKHTICNIFHCGAVKCDIYASKYEYASGAPPSASR